MNPKKTKQAKHSQKSTEKITFPPKLVRYTQPNITDNGEHKYSDEELRCQDISKEHCEELRERKFTNNPKDIFLEVRTLEEQFKHKIENFQLEDQEKISKLEKKLAVRYQNARNNKNREIERDIHDMELEIENSLQGLESREKMMISQIDMVYKINKPQLIEDALEILGLNFLSVEKE